jgi:hypothetical protein
MRGRKTRYYNLYSAELSIIYRDGCRGEKRRHRLWITVDEAGKIPRYPAHLPGPINNRSRMR